MKNKTLIIIISIIILLIIGPLLQPGYIFSLDQVLNPNGWFPTIGSHNYWIGVLSQICIFLHIPIWILEKILILFTFIAPAIGGYLLFSGKDKNNTNFGLLFGILLLLFNPFLYARFLDGQINIYLSYALYPLFFYFLKNTLESYSFEKVLLLGFWSLLLCLTSIHNIIFLLLIGIVFGIIYIKNIGAKKLCIIAISVLLFNFLWLTPFFFSQGEKFQLSQEINNFGVEHQQAFQTLSGDTNIYTHTLSLHGYWGEFEQRFHTTQSINPDYQKVFLIIFCIVLLGIYAKLRKHRFGKFEISLSIVALLSYVLALGIAENNIFSGINSFLYEYFPFYKGFREPQKWLIFIVIFYAYFGTFGVSFLTEELKKLPLEKYIISILSISLFLVPVFYSPQTLFGFSGQISIQTYPQEWKEIKNLILHENNSSLQHCEYVQIGTSQRCYNTLSFPWHSYMSIGFTGKNVGGWIVRYFGNNVLFGDNLEIKNIYSQSNRPESKIIEKYIGPEGIFKNSVIISQESLEMFISDLQGLGIKNIILLKEVDYMYYKNFLDILSEKKYLKVLQENDMVLLYKISPTKK